MFNNRQCKSLDTCKILGVRITRMNCEIVKSVEIRTPICIPISQQDQSVASLVLVTRKAARNQVTKTNRSVSIRRNGFSMYKKHFARLIFLSTSPFVEVAKAIHRDRYWWIWMSVVAESRSCYVYFAARLSCPSRLPDIGLLFLNRGDNRAASCRKR